MKESGIDWIGQIPEEWEVIKVKFFTYMKGRIGWQGLKADEFIDEGPYLVTGTDFKNGRVNWDTAYHISQKRYEQAPEIQLKQGDLLVTKDGTVGKLALIDELPDSASLNSHLLVLRPLFNRYDNHFLYYVLSSLEFKNYFQKVSIGSTMDSLSQEKMGEFIFALPNINEQNSISRYLDKKTAQLDKAKALLEEQIQKLKDYRASLVYETVTKGLDKTVTMKDSGIDWIGQVPEGWGVGKVKYFSQISAGATPDRNNSLFWSGNINWMSSGEVNQGIVKHTSETITDLALKRTSTKLLPNGTVMLALNGQGKTKGTAAVLAIESASNQSLASFIVDNKILNNMYLYYFFVANYYNIRGLKGEDRDGLNLQLVSNIVIPLFELEKQQKNVDFLDKKTVQIDKLIQIKNEQIDNINKQRQTLIYDYVTGKRRV
jgi:hypothetical protein